MADIEPTIYYEDFLEYYDKAQHLQGINLATDTGRDTSEDMHVDDPIMHYVTIYDVVERKYAGFSNAIQQIWHGSDNPKKWQVDTRFDGIHSILDEKTWLWLFLLHRVTGSGASFAHDHGFRNSILADVAINAQTVPDMTRYTLAEMRHGRKVFTSIGNQIPPFPKPVEMDGYTMRGSEVYIARFMANLVDAFHEYLVSLTEPISVCDGVDWVCAWHREHGLKQFKFVLTAWVMDVAEYYPNYVEPYSRVHYGANAIEALDFLFDNHGYKKRDFYHACMDRVVSDRFSVHCEVDTAKRMGRPYSLEDVCCDYIRYVECYVPKGYEHLEPWMVENRSRIPDHPKHHSFHRHVESHANRKQGSMF